MRITYRALLSVLSSVVVTATTFTSGAAGLREQSNPVIEEVTLKK